MTQSYNDPNNTPASDELDKILEDAYQLGRTDALLSASDHDILMPRMKAAITALRIKDRIDTLLRIMLWIVDKDYSDDLLRLSGLIQVELDSLFLELESQLNIGKEKV